MEREDHVKLAKIAMTLSSPGEYSVYRGKSDRSEWPGEPDILSTSIKCVRGVAAEAIQATLPLFNIDRMQAADADVWVRVTTFLTACAHERDEVMPSRYVRESSGTRYSDMSARS